MKPNKLINIKVHRGQENLINKGGGPSGNWLIRRNTRDFLGGPVVKIMLHAGGAGLILGQGTRIPHATWCDQKKLKWNARKNTCLKGPLLFELPAFRRVGLDGSDFLFIKEVLKIPIFMCPPSLLLFFSCSVMSDTLQCHGLQHARLPCPSLSPRACSNSCPSSQWHHPTISSSVVPFSSSLQSFLGSGSFLMSQLFA